MILLEANQSLLFGGIPLTDWIEAIGAIAAIVGVIVVFYQLFKDSKDKQSQIDVLTGLAKESKEQTNHLSSQVDQMIEGNKLQTEYISLFQKSVSFSEQSIQLTEEQKKLDEKRNKLAIRPFFTLGEVNITQYFVSLLVTNCGETTTLIDYEELENNAMKSDINKDLNKGIPKNKSILLNLSHFPPEKIKDECSINLKIIYEDIQGNKYYQIIEGKYYGPFNIQKQVEIPGQIQNQQK